MAKKIRVGVIRTGRDRRQGRICPATRSPTNARSSRCVDRALKKKTREKYPQARADDYKAAGDAGSTRFRSAHNYAHKQPTVDALKASKST